MSEALGMIECRSFPAMVEAADAMVKAAKVELVSYEKQAAATRPLLYVVMWRPFEPHATQVELQVHASAMWSLSM